MVGMESCIELTLEDFREIVRVGIVGRSIYKSTEYNSQRLVIIIIIREYIAMTGLVRESLG